MIGLYSFLDIHTSKIFVPKPRVFYVGGYQGWATARKYERWTGFESLEAACASILRTLSYERREGAIERGTNVDPAPPPVTHEPLNESPTIGQYADYVNDALLFPIVGKPLGGYGGYAPGSIIQGNDGDPGFPPRRNWFQRLISRF